MKRRRYAELSFEVPDSWVDISTITLVAQGEDEQAPSLVISREDRQGSDLKAYAHAALPELQRTAKKHKLHKEEEVTIAGRTGYRMEHDLIAPNRVRAKQVQYFFHSGDDVVVMSFTASKDSWPRRSKNLAAMVESLMVHED